MEFALDYAVRTGAKSHDRAQDERAEGADGIFPGWPDVAKIRWPRWVDDRIVDACDAARAESVAIRHDTNLFGDILSDEIAGLVGGLGMAPGGNIGEGAAIFEAVHGSAPDIAGKGIANPTALLLAAAMMLDHVNKTDEARRLRAAIDQALVGDNVRTGDLGGKAFTRDLTQTILRRLS